MSEGAVGVRVSEQLRCTTSALARNLQENPNLAENLSKVAIERTNLQALLTACIREVPLEMSLPSLTAYVTEHEQREHQIKETLERERALSMEVQSLKHTIRTERHKVLIASLTPAHRLVSCSYTVLCANCLC